MKEYTVKRKMMVETVVDVKGTLYDIVGHHIASRRKAMNLTQEDLSEKAGVSRASISNIEKGRHNVNLRTLELLCDFFQCKSSDILPF